MRLLCTLVTALALLAGGPLFAQAPPAASAQPLVWGRNDPGDVRAIQIRSDDGATWSDGNQRVFLLRGNVWIEQADAHVRATAAAVFVDEASRQKTGVYRVTIYTEGTTSLEIDTRAFEGPGGKFELNTRGQLGFKTFKTKAVVDQPKPQDPLFQRAVTALTGKAPVTPVAAGTIQQVAAVQPADPPPAPPAQTPQLQPPTTLPPVPGGPGGSMSPGQALPTQGGPVQPAPVVPAPAPAPVPAPAPGPVPPPAAGPLPVQGPSSISIRPRSSVKLKYNEFPMENGEKAVVFSPGVIISITDVKGTIEVAADRVVLWTRGDIRDLVEPGHADQARPGRGLEFYLSGNVEIHNVNVKDAQELRCNEAYYDVSRSVAIALDADFAIQQPGLPDKVHVFTPELHQLNAKLFEVSKSMVNASKLPYGPGLALSTGYATLEERRVEKTTIFGTTFFKRDTGELEYEDQRIFTGYNVVTELEGIPIFYLPYLQGDANDPLGPLQSAGIGYSKAFGFQLFTTFNIYDLVGIDPVPGTHWRLLADYLSSRGPAIGTDYNAVGKDFFGIKGKFETNVLGYLIDDHGTDLLGGDRGTQTVVGYPGPATVIPITHPELRGRLLANINAQELPYSLTFQGQVAAISDRNFEEQYFNKEWINGPNLETFAYLKQQENNWNWSILAEQRIRNWVTETDWLPKVEGHWIGQDFLDVFSNNVRASAGWAHLEPTHQPPPAFEPTDVNVETGRFEVMDELSLPFYAGPFKLVPYIVGEAAYYTEDITGVDRGRLYYGGGIRGSIPFSRLYPDVESELFNLNGLYHKIVASANYYWAHSSASMYNYPQLDRLNDDVSDQALRDIRPYQPGFNPSNAAMLNSGFFDPQFFALRKLVMSRVDTLDSIEVVELDLRQRLQTKRGFYGMQHIIDWMTLDVKASFFPQPNTQNFGEVVNFVEYDWNWNIGDRTSLFSSGWFDPHEGGGRAWNVGAQINRPDSTSLLLAYRQIDPLESKQVSAAITLPFSAKYSLTASTAYDFGVHNQINALSITRAGTDLQISLGVTYNSINNNFGFIFEIYPNLLPANKRVAGLSNLLASGR